MLLVVPVLHVEALLWLRLDSRRHCLVQILHHGHASPHESLVDLGAAQHHKAYIYPVPSQKNQLAPNQMTGRVAVGARVAVLTAHQPLTLGTPFTVLTMFATFAFATLCTILAMAAVPAVVTAATTTTAGQVLTKHTLIAAG